MGFSKIRDFIVEQTMQLLFFGALLSGVFVINLSKDIEIEWVSGLFGVPLPGSVATSSGVIVVYFIIGRVCWKKREMSRKEFADTLYFLGFLLTLTSLFFTFINLKIDTGNRSVAEISSDIAAKIPELVSYSGAALLTTIIGLLLRVIYVQYETETAPEVNDLTKEIKTASIAMREFSAAFTNAKTNFENEVKNVASAINSRSEEAQREFLQHSRQHIRAADAHFVSALNQISDTTSRVQGKFDQFAEAADSFPAKAIETTNATISGLSSTVSAAAKNKVEHLISQVLDEVKESVTAIKSDGTEAAEEILDLMKDVTQQIGRIRSQNLKTTSERLNSFEEKVKETIQVMEELQSKHESTDEILTQLSAALQRIEELKNLSVDPVSRPHRAERTKSDGSDFSAERSLDETSSTYSDTSSNPAKKQSEIITEDVPPSANVNYQYEDISTTSNPSQIDVPPTLDTQDPASYYHSAPSPEDTPQTSPPDADNILEEQSPASGLFGAIRDRVAKFFGFRPGE